MIFALRLRSDSVGILSLLASALLVSADSIERFGLSHSPLGAASVSSYGSYGLTIVDLEFTGTNGLSTELGAADSGAFIYPTTSSDVSEGYFMRAYAYGSVSGVSNSLISVVHGRRADYATF